MVYALCVPHWRLLPLAWRRRAWDGVGYLRGRSAGKAEAHQYLPAKINKRAAQATKEVSTVEAKINRMPDGAAADELRCKWMRK